MVSAMFNSQQVQDVLEDVDVACYFLQDMVAAPSDHWVHEYHQFDTLKDQSNPYMGELLDTQNLERSLHEDLAHIFFSTKLLPLPVCGLAVSKDNASGMQEAMFPPCQR